MSRAPSAQRPRAVSRGSGERIDHRAHGKSYEPQRPPRAQRTPSCEPQSSVKKNTERILDRAPHTRQVNPIQLAFFGYEPQGPQRAPSCEPQSPAKKSTEG